jgi:hypothetical protein
VEHTIEMTNTSPFELPFTCHLQKLSHRPLGGVPPFAVHPAEGMVAPGKKLKVTVTFRADHEPVFGITNMFTEVPHTLRTLFVVYVVWVRLGVSADRRFTLSDELVRWRVVLRLGD